MPSRTTGILDVRSADDSFLGTFDTGDFYDAASDEVIVPEDGVYLISVWVNFDPATAGSAQQVRLAAAGMDVPLLAFAASGEAMYVNGSIMLDLDAGQSVVVSGRQTSGSAIDIELEGLHLALMAPPVD